MVWSNGADVAAAARCDPRRARPIRGHLSVTSHLRRDGVDDGDRTRDHWSHSPVLYQLSYIHHHRILGCRKRGKDIKVARLEGIEPPTDGLEIRCSILLSYRRGVLSGPDRNPSWRPELRNQSRGERI